MAAEEFLCARCARHTRTCCQDTEIYVTLGDIERIERHTGRSDFFEYRRPADPVYLDQDDDPLWRDNVIQPDGTRRVVKALPDGDCTFLGPAGCTLSLDARPLVCRLYPYHYTETVIEEEPEPGCPVELLRPNQHLYSTIQMNIQDVRQWHAQLYAEIRAEADFADECESNAAATS